MKVTATFKQRALALFFALAAAAVVWVVLDDNSGKDKTVEILRAVKDIPANAQVTRADVTVVEVGSYNLPADVIPADDMDKLIGLYTVRPILKGREIHVSDVLKDKKPDKAWLYEPGKIIVAFDTDLSRAVGGLPKEGSLITLDGYLKDPNGGAGRTELMPGPPVKVCMVMNSSADEAKKESGAMGSGSSAKPAAIVVEVNTLQQASWINRVSNEGSIYCYLHTGDAEPHAVAPEPLPPTIGVPANEGVEPISETSQTPPDEGGFKAE